jgi:hypothetical protein
MHAHRSVARMLSKKLLTYEISNTNCSTGCHAICNASVFECQRGEVQNSVDSSKLLQGKKCASNGSHCIQAPPITLDTISKSSGHIDILNHLTMHQCPTCTNQKVAHRYRSRSAVSRTKITTFEVWCLYKLGPSDILILTFTGISSSQLFHCNFDFSLAPELLNQILSLIPPSHLQSRQNISKETTTAFFLQVVALPKSIPEQTTYLA